MTRAHRTVSAHNPRTARKQAGKSPRRLRPLWPAERLEDRTLPSVTLLNGVVRFTEDVAGAADTLLLRVNMAGRLAYSLNGGAFTTDLDSTVAGSQESAAAALARIDVLLGAGNDVLGVDGITDPAVIPIQGGIVFAADGGVDRLDVSHDQNLTLSGSTLTVGGRKIAFADLDAARLTGGNGDTVLDAGAFSGPTTLDGGNGKDTLIGGAGDDILLGVAGGDVMDGRGGNDQIFSGNSGTTMIGGTGNDSLFGGNGQDQATGGDGDDQLFGGNGTDFLDGGAGNDVFVGGIGNDTAAGGAGTDRVMAIGDLDWTLSDTALTGEGTDVLSSIEEAQLTGGGRDNVLNAITFSGHVTLQGGGGNDVLRGGSGFNHFRRPVGEVGNVSMFGGPVGSINDYHLWLQGAITLTSPGGYDKLIFLSAVTLDLNKTDGTPQAVETSGSTVALHGFFEQLLGSDFNDDVTAASNTTVTGGAGNDKIVVSGKANVVVDGGADADTLQQTGGTNIVLSGDIGADTLISEGGTGIVITGGADADSLQQIGGTAITLAGDSGADTLVSSGGTSITITGGADADSLQQTAGTNISMTGGADADTLLSSGGTNITMSGGADADSLQQTGGTAITLAGDDGLDSLVSIGGTDIRLTGGKDADTLQQTGGTDIVLAGDDGLDTLISVGSARVEMSGGADADSLLSQEGTDIQMSGGSDADTLQQVDGTRITLAGDSGLDVLIGEGGTAVVMSGGADADSLQQTGGTDITLAGDDGLDALIVEGSITVVMNGGADADSLVSTSGMQIVMNGQDGDDLLTAKGGSSYTLGGGIGNDTIVLAGASLGTVAVSEFTLPGPVADLSRDTLDLSGFTGGPISLNLAVTGPQTIAAGLTLILADGLGIENVIGTAGADTVTGNGRDNLLVGADLLDPPAGPAPAWDGVTQLVFLDFDTHTDPGEHAYSASERAAIKVRLEDDYLGPDPTNPWFHFQFLLAPPVSGPFATVHFNRDPLGGGTGGYAYDLDFRNLDLGGEASVQAKGILGFPNQPADTTQNWVSLSAKIAAHELGHLVGLLHQDSFGPIGYGPHAPPGGAGYNPNYPGAAAGFETFDHLMGSPASVGSDRFNDTRDLYFGEREAIKLAFAESGTVVLEQAAAHRGFNTAQPLTLSALTVPNTLMAGALNARKTFSVSALAVVGPGSQGASVVIDPVTGKSESDFYSLVGRKGDIFNIDVRSLSLTRLGVDSIDPMVRVYDGGHNLVAYYSGSAFNDDQFEPTDAAILDLMLPADGTYYVEVDTFFNPNSTHPETSTDTDVGQYELFVYRFDAGNEDDVGDALSGQGGNDTVIGGLGGDSLRGGLGNDGLKGGDGDDTYFDAVGSDTVADEGGRDVLDFSLTPRGVAVNLGLDAGQSQILTSAGDTLAITGTVEVVFGSAFADSITGNAADNELNGRSGNDTIRAGSGNDVVLGGDGNDTLDGDGGRDLLIGGLGADALKGLDGDDVLIGGRTSFDADPSALGGIMAEWTGTGTYAQRVARITGLEAGGLNGTTYLVKDVTVLDDSRAEDALTGGLGLDLFFRFNGDRVTDRESPAESVL
jgi:Ca2+-binding RTX toxin-like protein